MREQSAANMILILVATLALDVVAPAAAQESAPKLRPGAWHYHSVPCVDSSVVSVTPRLQSLGQKTFTAADFENSGVQVSFGTHLGADPVYPQERASVTHYQDTDENDIMMRERPGDRVQVCFLAAPAPTEFCNPDKDGRGRVYRVYDYRQHASYAGMNSEHDCGGA
jgi:hypothetical protein